MIGQAVTNGVADDVNTYLPESDTSAPADGRFTACVNAGTKTSQKAFNGFISKLKATSESLFLRKLIRSIPAPISSKNHATAYAFGGPDSSASPRFDPTGGRNIGST